MEKKFKIVIKKEDLLWKPRMGIQVGRIFKDKKKYNRKKKHKSKEKE
jgi:hypothetical protein